MNICVTDDSVLEMTDKREQPPRLPVMALIGPEVNRLEDAHVYLDETNPKSGIAVDLLLGVQGWRRFAFVNPLKFLTDITQKDDNSSDNVRRLFAIEERVILKQKQSTEIYSDIGGRKPTKKVHRKYKKINANAKCTTTSSDSDYTVSNT